MNYDLSRWAAALGLEQNVALALVWTLAGLVAGTVLRSLRAVALPNELTRDRLSSLATWWVIFAVLVAAVVVGRAGVVLLVAATSLYGLWEFRQLVARHSPDQTTWGTAYLLSAGYYLVLLLGSEWKTFPVVVVASLAGISAISGKSKGVMRDIAYPAFAVGLVVYGYSFLLLLEEPATENSVAGPLGWFLLLGLLAELNDIAQAVWGRLVGRRKVSPVVSPNKTWEGLVLGVGSTMIAAFLLAPLLSPLAGIWAVLAGLLIGGSGFLGDVSISAIKRECLAKESGRLLPGQGGMLDRIDSLTVSAPVFYYYILLLTRLDVL